MSNLDQTINFQQGKLQFRRRLTIAAAVLCVFTSAAAAFALWRLDHYPLIKRYSALGRILSASCNSQNLLMQIGRLYRFGSPPN